jgi:hypothetical protein
MRKNLRARFYFEGFVNEENKIIKVFFVETRDEIFLIF